MKTRPVPPYPTPWKLKVSGDRYQVRAANGRLVASVTDPEVARLLEATPAMRATLESVLHQVLLCAKTQRMPKDPLRRWLTDIVNELRDALNKASV